MEYREILDAIGLLVQAKFPGRQYSTVQLNDGLTAKLHVDRNNMGLSIILSLGPSTGGEFWTNGTNQTGSGVWDTMEQWQPFDGRTPHCSLPCYGRKFSVIVYTNTAITHNEAEDAIQAAITLGIPVPDPVTTAIRIDAQGPAVAYQTAHLPG